LNDLVPPTHWRSEALSQQMFAQLEQSKAAIRALPNGDLVYETLSRLPSLA
jgi:hypothetical protein